LCLLNKCRRSKEENRPSSPPEAIRNEAIKRMIKETSKVSMSSFDSETSFNENDVNHLFINLILI
jgi:hypothetical protein